MSASTNRFSSFCRFSGSQFSGSERPWGSIARLAAAALAAAGCGNSAGPAAPTFTTDVQPLLAAHCQTCHVSGGVAPFPLVTFDDAVAHKALIAADVSAKIMPPWHADDACNSYQGDRSLTAAEITTLTTWALAAAPLPGPAIPPVPPQLPPGLSRTDVALSMPAAYTPDQSVTDDYHCFMLDWPETATKYVTGLTVSPGNTKIVHHVIAYLAQPDQLASFEEQLQTLPDGGVVPSYSCFGGPNGMGALTGWLGVWVPGSSLGDFPSGTGVKVLPGSKIILQVHYNVVNGPGESDLSSLALKLDDAVQKPAALIPFTNPFWVDGRNMPIAANNSDVEHAFQFDLAPYLALDSANQLQSNKPFTVYGVGAHMHLRGSSQNLTVTHTDGSQSCLLNVPNYQFRWQGSYFLQQPLVISPGDRIGIDCHWNNSQANQPYVNGTQVTSHDLNWGEGTGDEMCLGLMYVTN